MTTFYNKGNNIELLPDLWINNQFSTPSAVSPSEEHRSASIFNEESATDSLPTTTSTSTSTSTTTSTSASSSIWNSDFKLNKIPSNNSIYSSENDDMLLDLKLSKLILPVQSSNSATSPNSVPRQFKGQTSQPSSYFALPHYKPHLSPNHSQSHLSQYQLSSVQVPSLSSSSLTPTPQFAPQPPQVQVSNVESQFPQDQFPQDQQSQLQLDDKKASVNTQLYKTELCDSFVKLNYCPYGNKCQFAHGHNELKLIERPANWRSKPCVNWARFGSCRYGTRCCFKHGN